MSLTYNILLCFVGCNHQTKVPSSPNGPHTSVNNTPDTEKSPPAIPPKQHKHCHLHSNTCSLPNGVHLIMNGSVVHGAVDL